MKHIDAVSHTRGESQFVDDMPQPSEMLYAAVFSSPVMHGKIIALHVQDVCSMDGIVAVLTSKDIPGENQIGPIIQDEELLASAEVCYVGQPVALVIGTSPEIARKGVRKITIDVEQLPAITDPKEAFSKGNIIGSPRTFILGDVEATWQKCDLVLEGVCDIGGQEHVYLETQRARAIPLEENNLCIYSATQGPSAVQRHAAKVLGLPGHNIEVDVKRLGGGFGGKEDQATPWACMAALAAWHTKKPVELVLGRADDIKMTGKRHPYKSDFKIGVTKEGKILAYEANHYQNSGATADLSPAVLERTLFHGTNSYFIPNVKIFGVCCRTNLPSNTAFRGFGGPQGMFVIESAIAKVAEKLDIPREEIQTKNLLKENDLFPYGQQVGNCRSLLTWNKAVEKYKLSEIRKRVEDYNKTHFEIKKGMAVMPICFGISFTTTYMNQASALVLVYTDGSISVSTGGVEMGQGLKSNIASIAAKGFGIRDIRIKIESTNTTRVANMSPSAASATTVLNGNATLIAIGQVLDRLKSMVAEELGVQDKGRITIVNEKVLCDGRETDWTWDRLVQTAHLNRIDLSAHGFFATPEIYFDKIKEKGHPFAYHIFGTAIIEVTLDCLRGTYDIDSVKIVHDLGRPLSELVDRGQIEGGLAQGLGWMTIEDLSFNEKGQLLSGALATYKVPDVYFMPDDIELTFLEDEGNTLGPYGNKAVGEPPLMYGIGVFFAIRCAMRAFRPQREFALASPLTPERVLLQLYAD
ncbi:MAG: molybdopterin-dependent oxidoreductase [Candidatus Brocadiaceae bacterium]|uniref:xanthine dehydrogenase molybdopterin binding subunit n=1 Tax=Candidatus Wunengus sp. YC61 TaxID=3367698 RepID=UPI0027206020|nr:molybdopterin-dependent oxidoreductase [Candidatus Brocadiaceae bacterium]